MTSSTMLKMFECLTNSRVVLGVLFTLCVGALAFGYMAEHLYDIKPCALCLYQRYVMGTLIAITVLGLLPSLSRYVQIIMVSACLASLVGFGLGAYHVGVEQHWWKGPASCSAESVKHDRAASIADQIRAVKAAMLKKSQSIVSCDQVNWRILGVSATIWTTLFYVYLMVIALYTYCLNRRDHVVNKYLIV